MPGLRRGGVLGVVGSTRAHEHLALRILAGAHGADLVVGQDRVPAESGTDGRVDRPEERIDRAVAAALGGQRYSP